MIERKKIKISEIANILNSKYIGENYEINALDYQNNARDFNTITFCEELKYLEKTLQNKFVNCILLNKELYTNQLPTNITYILVDSAMSMFFDLHLFLHEKTSFYDNFLFEKKIGLNCNIHNLAVIENGVEIGNNAIIGANVVILKGSIIGDNVIIKPNSVIGGNGFEVKNINKIPKIIQHTGGVKIWNNVEIGSNTCIDKSLFDGFTEISNNTKIDNLVQIGHNVKIGENCKITAGVILAGSVILLDNVFVGLNSTVLNNVTLEHNSFVSANTLVVDNVGPNIKVFGLPAKKIY